MVSVTTDAFGGMRVAELVDLAPGQWTLRLVLSLDHVEVASRRVLVQIRDAPVAVTVLITRDCQGVECPAGDNPSAVACLGMRCIDPSCTPEPPER